VPILPIILAFCAAFAAFVVCLDLSFHEYYNAVKVRKSVSRRFLHPRQVGPPLLGTDGKGKSNDGVETLALHSPADVIDRSA
jgi:hypothetical protein